VIQNQGNDDEKSYAFSLFSTLRDNYDKVTTIEDKYGIKSPLGMSADVFDYKIKNLNDSKSDGSKDLQYAKEHIQRTRSNWGTNFKM
jgi:hypothetical protein